MENKGIREFIRYVSELGIDDIKYFIKYLWGYIKVLFKFFALLAAIAFVAFLLSLLTNRFLESFNKTADATDATNTLSNLSIAWFAAMSLIWAIKSHNDDKKTQKKHFDLNNFAFLEPAPISALINERELIFDKDIFTGDNNTKLAYGNFCKKDIWINTKHSKIKFVALQTTKDHSIILHGPLQNISEKDDNKLLFCIVNNGKSYAQAKKATILFRKKIINGDDSVYIKEPNYFREECLEKHSLIFPQKEGGKSIVVFTENIPEYNELIKNYKNREFIVVIEYLSVPEDRLIKQAYRARITSHYIDGKKLLFLRGFSILNKKQVKKNIEKKYAKEIIKSSIF